MDRDSELLVAYLRSRPQHAFVPWTSPQFEFGMPWSTHPVDVRTVDGDAPARRWAWTIVGPDDIDECDPEELWCFEWPHDVDVYELWKAPDPPRIASNFVLELSLPRDEDADPNEALLAHQGVVVRSGWTSDAVSAALNNWAQVHSGRDDLHFFWDDIAQFSAVFDASDSVTRKHATLGLGHEFAVADEAESALLQYLREAIEHGVEDGVLLRRILDEF